MAMPALSTDEWNAVEAVLKKHQAKLSVAHVGAWLDDGDSERGDLYVSGSKVGKKTRSDLPFSLG